MTTTQDTPPVTRPTLELRITNVLLRGGFTGATRFTRASKPSFHVSEGVGATVVLSWDAPEAERSEMLARYERCLSASGLRVENHDRYLYVHPPCPPSAVADMIVCWDEVQEGDLFLLYDRFELAEKIETLPVRTGPGEFIRVTCRGHASDHRPFDYAAVRRYDTSEGE